MDEYLSKLVKEIRESLNISENDEEFNREAGLMILKTSTNHYTAQEFAKLALEKIAELLPIISGMQNIPNPIGLTTYANPSVLTPAPPPSNLPVLTDDQGNISLDDDGNPIHHVDYEIDYMWRTDFGMVNG